MKIGVFADAHFSLSSSIVLGEAGSISGRLNSLVKSFKWMYSYFEKVGVDLVVNLGDLTDKPTLRAEEITALQEALSFSNLPHVHILGNHEMVDRKGSISSINFLKSFPSSEIIVNPTVAEYGGRNMLFLPYRDYKDEELSCPNVDIVFSHIDIKNSYLGGEYLLQEGVSASHLSKKFGLVINGHIHVGSWVKKNVVNVGSISGLNFASMGSKWKPSVGVLDVETMDFKVVSNPYALQFEKLTISALGELKKFIGSLKNPECHVLQVRCPYLLKDDVRSLLNQFNVKYSKIVAKIEKGDSLGDGELFEKVNSIEDGFTMLGDYISKKNKNKDFSSSEISSVLKKAYNFKL